MKAEEFRNHILYSNITSHVLTQPHGIYKTWKYRKSSPSQRQGYKNQSVINVRSIPQVGRLPDWCVRGGEHPNKNQKASYCLQGKIRTA